MVLGRVRWDGLLLDRSAVGQLSSLSSRTKRERLPAGDTPRSVSPAGNRCHFVLLDKDESCPTADLSNLRPAQRSGLFDRWAVEYAPGLDSTVLVASLLTCNCPVPYATCSGIPYVYCKNSLSTWTVHSFHFCSYRFYIYSAKAALRDNAVCHSFCERETYERIYTYVDQTCCMGMGAWWSSRSDPDPEVHLASVFHCPQQWEIGYFIRYAVTHQRATLQRPWRSLRSEFCMSLDVYIMIVRRATK